MRHLVLFSTKLFLITISMPVDLLKAIEKILHFFSYSPYSDWLKKEIASEIYFKGEEN